MADLVHLTVDDVDPAVAVCRRWSDDVAVVDGDWLVLRLAGDDLPRLLAALRADGVDVRTADAVLDSAGDLRERALAG